MKQKINKLPSYIKLNHKVRPQDDFYAYVCHHWCQANPYPETRSRWGVFNALNEKVEVQLHELLNKWLKVKEETLTHDQKQVVIHYKALTQKDDHHLKSLKTLKDLIDKINQKKSKAALLAEAANFGQNGLFALNIHLDDKNNQRFCLGVDSAGLTLPNRDYYLNKTFKMRGLRKAYLDFIKTHTRALAKLDLKYDLTAEKILEIETVLAELSWPLHKARNPQKTYNPYDWDEFCKVFNFDWQTYFEISKVDCPQDIMVSQPSYLRGVLKYLDHLSLDELKAYLTYLLLLKFGNLIDEKITKVNFEFFGKILSGIAKIKPLKKRAFENVNNIFCDVFGQAYVKDNFSAADKEDNQMLASKVSEAFEKRLANNDWMSEESSQYAQKKLANIIVNLGYTNHWASYKSLNLASDNPLQNYLQIITFEHKRSLDLLNQKPKRECFDQLNENIQKISPWTNIVLLNTNYPATFLQPPFYDSKAGFAYNIGAVGAVIGHELTHNFDNNGSQYDSDGHLQVWLKKEEQKAFKKAAVKLIKTANKHRPAPKVKMKGKQVIGELIADLGGLEIVLDIIKDEYSDEKERKEALKVVFISYAFKFAINESVETKVIFAKTGVHPDGPFRVNGILSHCDDFYKVFDVKKGDKLYLKPDDRAHIW